jgi:hypothetical protein
MIELQWLLAWYSTIIAIIVTGGALVVSMASWGAQEGGQAEKLDQKFRALWRAWQVPILVIIFGPTIVMMVTNNRNDGDQTFFLA